MLIRRQKNKNMNQYVKVSLKFNIKNNGCKWIMKKLILLSTTCLLFSASVQAGLYKWVDDSGNVHFSDKMPVAASKKAHTKIEAHGIVKKEIDPLGVIKNAEGRKAALNQKEIERIQLDKIKEEKRKVLAEKQKRDDFLLTTYNNKKELKDYFENKIKMVKGNSNIFESHNVVLKKKIKKLLQKKKTSSHKKTIESIDKKIVRINDSISQYDKALEVNSEELVKLSKNFQVDMKRYTELTK